MDNINTYRTSDLYLSAFLKLKGHKFSVEKNKNKIFFIFDKNDVLMSNVADYLSESGSCEPLLFTNTIKNLKNLIHNF
jgi:hypothetical protein